MHLIIANYTIEIESYNISVNFKPYNKRIHCSLLEDADIDEISLFIEKNYTDTFTLDGTIYTNFPNVELSVRDDGKATRKTLIFNQNTTNEE